MKPWSNGLLIRLIWQLATVDAAVTVLHGRWGPGVERDLSLANLINDIAADAMTSSGLRARLGLGYRLHRVTIRDMDQPFQPEIVSTRNAIAGTSGIESMPLQNTVCVTMRTALAGRSFRGRTYISGFTEMDNLANGLPSTQARDTARDFMTNFDAALKSPTPFVTLGVLSTVTQGLERIVPLFTPAQSYSIATPRWTTQRRRVIPGI